MVHKHIKKHVKKHQRKYKKFVLFFSILVLFNAFEHLIALQYFVAGNLTKTLLIVFLLAIIFTLIEEGLEKIWKDTN